jgi:predicted Zn-dependent peptidase
MANPMLDRTLTPVAAPLEKILFPKVRIAHLTNGIPVYLLQFGTQEIVELNALFPAGKSFESAPSVSGFTAKMIQEGTRTRNSLEFARVLDRFGAFIHVESGYESATVGLTSLAKHLQSTVPLWAEMMLEPAFPADELEKMRDRTLQHMDVEEQKTAYIARKEYNRLLFGTQHPYGAHSGKDDIRAITLEQLKEFHASHFHVANASVIATGRFDEAQLLSLLEATIGAQKLDAPDQKISLSGSHGRWEMPTAATGLHYFEKPESMQATIRVGHRAFPRSHPDHYPMQVVNTVYGGYFGSRLMKNIREEKGYTYGVGSAWLTMKYDGLFVVQTDVGNQYINSTLEEIRKEMQLLIEKGLPLAELDLVRNYMLGKSATGRETPSQLLGLIQNALINDFSFEEIDRKHDIIMALTTDDIQRLAAKYFQPSQLLEVVCGKM